MLKGRGSQIYLPNRFEKNYYTSDDSQENHPEGDAPLTRIYLENPREIISKNDSPDIPFTYSINPYQGCEHGCIYCYARNSHEYWGFDAGLDFESRIIAKPDAPVLLRKKFSGPAWKPELIVMSGNTDCYQPVEKEFKITRGLLQVFQQFGNPVSIITKNVLILRDLDILQDLASENLTKVIFSITTLDESLRQKLEPRTATAAKKLSAIERMVSRGIPVSVMMGPVIPGLNNHEIPSIIRHSYEAGAYDINMILVRLNGKIGVIFRDWLKTHYPEKEQKVWNQIRSLHGGQVSESRWGVRMRGEGKMADTLHHLFKTIKGQYFRNKISHDLALDRYRRNGSGLLF